MKNQNRIAQRILNEAKRSWERGGKHFTVKTSTVRINDDLKDHLLRRIGAERQGIELSATVFLREDCEPEHVELTVKTLAPPYLQKTLNFYNGLEYSGRGLNVEGLGEKISWIVSEVLKGNGKAISTPEDDYQEYLDREEQSKYHDDYDDYDWGN